MSNRAMKNYLPRAELDANLTKLYGKGCNAHPSVLIHPRTSKIARLSHITREELIGGPRHTIGSNHEKYIVRYTAIADRLYVAQSWATGIEHSFTSIGALKAFLGGKSAH